tara:strand:- start:28 stop:243 length:216 start_codon:yes stop_codon:yes gene_type:complete
LKDKQKVSLKEVNLWGSRNSIDEAYEFATSILETEVKNGKLWASSYTTALMIVWNTLATKYDIYPKDVDSE